ncbi:ribosome recycling factor [candidate division WS5 bacterium]|uniref:Ribosome-recycling factor n=1 Tax=candidate division WS5 bacterium TaxID=2093353 RepID=A0A419DEI1_9BACT|nr:MAG: ribosome recycling factor [candidate division WS5 bacterium]
MEETLKESEPKFQKALEILEEEMATIHTGRASASMVEDIMVDVYGSKNPLKSVASISIPEPRSILIQAWDKSNLSQIETAIRDSDLNVNPVNTGENIRINLPELTEERRKDFAKIAKEKAENARVSIRNIRSDAWNKIKKAKADGDISEDDMYYGEEQLQKVVDKYNKQIDEILANKEKDLLTL